MEISLAGKNALVTGGTRGIGREIAEELADSGANVAIVFHSNRQAADETIALIKKKNPDAETLAIKADIARISSIKRVFDVAEAKLGKLDIVISNAGTVINKDLGNYTVEDFNQTFATNTKAAFFVMQQAAVRLNKGGRIIAISSGGTKLMLSGTSLYLGSKGAVEQFVRGMSQEVGNKQITVNAVSPGFTDTGLLTDHFRKVDAGMSPFKRVGQPSDIAHVVIFLASKEAAWVTGQNIGVGGGVM